VDRQCGFGGFWGGRVLAVPSLVSPVCSGSRTEDFVVPLYQIPSTYYRSTYPTFRLTFHLSSPPISIYASIAAPSVGCQRSCRRLPFPPSPVFGSVWKSTARPHPSLTSTASKRHPLLRSVACDCHLRDPSQAITTKSAFGTQSVTQSLINSQSSIQSPSLESPNLLAVLSIQPFPHFSRLSNQLSIIAFTANFLILPR